MPCAQDKIVYVKIQQSSNIVLSTLLSLPVFLYREPLQLIRGGKLLEEKKQGITSRTQSFSMFTMVLAVRT